MNNSMQFGLLKILVLILVLLFQPIHGQEHDRNFKIDDFINVVKLSDRVIVIRTGVNYFDAVSAIATPKGIVVIDAGNTPQLTEKYRKIFSREFGRNDFIYLINTHSHKDHTGGNQVFADLNIIGSEKTKEAMIREWNDKNLSLFYKTGVAERETRLKNLNINSEAGKQALYSLTIFQMAQKDIEPGGMHITTLPSITFNKPMTLSLDGITIEIMYMGNAHSDSDTWIYIPEENLLFIGDVFFKGGEGNLSYFASEETEGLNDVNRWKNIIYGLLTSDKPVKTIVRGHGDIMPLVDLETFGRQINDILMQYQSGKEIYPLSNLEKILNIGGIEAVRTECKKLLDNKSKYFFLERGFVVPGNHFIGDNQIEAAIELYKLYSIVFPKSAIALNTLSNLYQKSGKIELAIESLEKLLELNPQNTNVQEILKKLKK